MSRKRRREQSSVDIQLVEIYDDLANESKDIRSKAIHAFLTKFSPQSNQSSEQLAEAVRRLIRGLCSGRKAARLGFSISLTELLFQRWGATPVNGAEQLRVSELIDILIKQTETTGKVDGQVRNRLSVATQTSVHVYLGGARSSFRPFIWRGGDH